MSRKFPRLKACSLMLLLILLANACKYVSSKEPEVDAVLRMENEKNAITSDLKKYGNSFAAAWSGGNPEAVAAFYSPDGVMQLNDRDPIVGREAIKKLVANSMQNLPNLKVVVDSLDQVADGLKYYWTLTGTNTGPGGAGNQLHISGTSIWQLNARGLVQYSLGTFDAEEFDRQMTGK